MVIDVFIIIIIMQRSSFQMRRIVYTIEKLLKLQP